MVVRRAQIRGDGCDPVLETRIEHMELVEEVRVLDPFGLEARQQTAKCPLQGADLVGRLGLGDLSRQEPIVRESARRLGEQSERTRDVPDIDRGRAPADQQPEQRPPARGPHDEDRPTGDLVRPIVHAHETQQAVSPLNRRRDTVVGLFVEDVHQPAHGRPHVEGGDQGPRLHRAQTRRIAVPDDEAVAIHECHGDKVDASPKLHDDPVEALGFRTIKGRLDRAGDGLGEDGPAGRDAGIELGDFARETDDRLSHQDDRDDGADDEHQAAPKGRAQGPRHDAGAEAHGPRPGPRTSPSGRRASARKPWQLQHRRSGKCFSWAR